MRAAQLALLALGAAASPLWDYVHYDDGAFSWYDTNQTITIAPGPISGVGYTAYLLNLTSQHWVSPEFSDRYVWTHQLLVVVPNNLNKNYTSNAALWITGGDNDNPGMPQEWDEDVLVCAALATDSGTICATLYQVPNQPVVFPADPLQKRRSEDAAVAFTWLQYMVNASSTPDWIIYFAMAKAATRAMDAVEQFAAQKGFANISKWMAFGASKRGATTWLTGAANPDRMIGIAPVVFDLLNWQEGMQAMYRTLGGWTFAFQDYYDLGVQSYLGTPYLDKLAAQVDPLQLAVNLSMPKLVIDATGDEFFQVQDDQFWWGKLPGETLRMMVDNAEHSMATGALYLVTGVEAWYAALIRNSPRPTFSWSIDATSGAITIVATGTKPREVVMRHADTMPADGNVRRDFRLVAGNTPANPCKYIPVQIFGSACLRPLVWLGENVGATSNSTNSWTYVLEQPMPASGWRGFLAELYYPGPAGTNTTFQLTTQVSIIPNTYPFPPCSGAACQSVLV